MPTKKTSRAKTASRSRNASANKPVRKTVKKVAATKGAGRAPKAIAARKPGRPAIKRTGQAPLDDWAPPSKDLVEPKGQGLSFDVVTGDWLPAPPPRLAAAADPAAFRRGGGAVVLSVLLGIDLAVFALGLLFGIIGGSALVFLPDSDMADRVRDSVGESSPVQLVQSTALSLVMFGVVPFFWVLGTRLQPWTGTWKYLALRFGTRDWLRGVALVPGLLLSVLVLSTLYVLATEGPAGLQEGNETDNPAVQAIVDNLSWPVAIFVALAAGVGEEIFFRGVLQRWLGVWGQAIVFGLAHAGGGYVPQILFATGLGVLFGWLLKRGWSMWTLILAHALYDFVLLALALTFPEFA